MPPAPDSLALWFHVADPDAVVGEGGSFPIEFGPGSRVRCRVKPATAAHVYLIMVSVSGRAGPVKLELVAPPAGDSAPLPASKLTELPGGDRFFSQPRGASAVAFVAAAVGAPVDRSNLVASLDGVSRELSASRLPAEIPSGQTLWYGRTSDAWTTAGGSPAPRSAAAALEAACQKIKAALGECPARLCGAAAACATSQPE